MVFGRTIGRSPISGIGQARPLTYVTWFQRKASFAFAYGLIGQSIQVPHSIIQVVDEDESLLLSDVPRPQPPHAFSNSSNPSMEAWSPPFLTDLKLPDAYRNGDLSRNC